MPTSTTVQTIGSKKANIRTQGQENWKISVSLTILLSSGEKLAPLLLFQAKKENIQKENWGKYIFIKIKLF